MFLKFEFVLICSKINTEYNDIISSTIITLQRGLNNFCYNESKIFFEIVTHTHKKRN